MRPLFGSRCLAAPQSYKYPTFVAANLPQQASFSVKIITSQETGWGIKCILNRSTVVKLDAKSKRHFWEDRLDCMCSRCL
jgi:hypothetical protein